MIKSLTFILLTSCAVNLMAHEVRHEHVCDDSGKCKYFFEKEDLSPDSQYIEVQFHNSRERPSAYVKAPIEIESVCESGSFVDYHHYYMCE